MTSERSPARRPLFWVLIGLVALLLAIRVALPWGLVRVAETFLSEELQAVVRIGDIDLGLIEGEIIVEDLTIFEPEDAHELARAKRLSLDVDMFALLSGELEAELVSVEAPRVRVAYDARGRLNWRIAESSGDEPIGVKEADEPAAAFRVRLARVELGAGELQFEDETEDGLPTLGVELGAFTLLGAEIVRPKAGAPIAWSLDSAELGEWRLAVVPGGVDPFQFELVASAGPMGEDGALPIKVGMSRVDGVELSVTGSVRPDPLEVELDVGWNQLSSKAVVPLASLRGMRVDRGDSRGSLHVKLSLEDGPERGLMLSGHVEHTDLVLESDGPPRTKIELARVHGELESLHLPIPAAPVDPPPTIRVHWSRIELEAPIIDVTLPAPGDESATGAKEDAEIAAEEEATPSTPLDIRVAELKLRDGRMRWHDLSIGADHEHEISRISVDAKELRAPEIAFEELRLVLGSLGDKPLTIQGSWLVDSGSFDVDTSRIDLMPWNSSISHYSDYEVSRGHVSLHSRIEVDGDNYKAPSRLTFHNIQAQNPSDRFKQIFGLSLGTTVALLSDSAGNIQLDVDVAGTLSEGAGVDIPAAVVDGLREAIFNALGGTAAAGVDLTGMALRRVGEVFVLGVGEAVFPPGDTSMPIDSRVALDSAAGIVKKKRGARLELIPQVVSDDLVALALIERETNILKAGVAAARAIFGGGRNLDEKVTKEVQHLSVSRLDAVERYLVEHSGLERGQILRTPWDEKVREGTPRVLLRIKVGKKKGKTK